MNPNSTFRPSPEHLKNFTNYLQRRINSKNASDSVLNRYERLIKSLSSQNNVSRAYRERDISEIPKFINRLSKNNIKLKPNIRNGKAGKFKEALNFMKFRTKTLTGKNNKLYHIGRSFNENREALYFGLKRINSGVNSKITNINALLRELKNRQLNIENFTKETQNLIRKQIKTKQITNTYLPKLISGAIKTSNIPNFNKLNSNTKQFIESEVRRAKFMNELTRLANNYQKKRNSGTPYNSIYKIPGIHPGLVPRVRNILKSRGVIIN